MIPTLTVFVLLAAGPQPSLPRAESARLMAEALDATPGRPARVMITHKDTNRHHIVSLNETMGPLRALMIRDDKARVLLLGDHGFTVVDPAGRVPPDEIYARSPVASDDGRWIAFQRFFPPTHPGPSEGVALYDTRQSREQNHAAYPVAGEREWQAGTALYPLPAEWKDLNAVARRGDAYELSSPLTWSGSKTRPVLAFLMHRGEQQVLVFADPSGDPVRACVEKLPGPSTAWRVASVDVKATAQGSHQVRVESRALGGSPPSATFTFGPSCSP